MSVALISVLLLGLAAFSGCRSVDEQVSAPQTDAPDAPTTVDVDTERGVVLALKFVSGAKATYQVVSETERSIKWEGDTAKKPATFHDGRTGHKVDMTFEQQVREVDDAGNAVVAVTIEALRYFGQAREKVVLEFDSSRPEDQNSPLAKLIGQSYTITMTPKGEVSAIIDVAAARRAVQGDLPGNKTAAKLLSDGVIRERHEIPALMAAKTTAVQPQEQWSDVKAFSFGLMGAKTYERLYTLEAVDQDNGEAIATVEMKAIPATVEPGQLDQTTNPFAMSFDNTESYTGRLDLDLSNGEVQNYNEDLRIEWVTADPAAIASGQADPAVLKMGVVESHRLERLD